MRKIIVSYLMTLITISSSACLPTEYNEGLDVPQQKADDEDCPDEPVGLSRRALKVDKPEGLLGNWMADMLVKESTCTGMQAADLALLSHADLHSDIPDGKITRGDVDHILAEDARLVLLKMSGKKLLKLMQCIALLGGEPVSQSVRMKVGDKGCIVTLLIAGESIDPKRKYTIATIAHHEEINILEATGLKKGRDFKQFELTDESGMTIFLREIMKEHIIKTRVVDAKIEGRIGF